MNGSSAYSQTAFSSVAADDTNVLYGTGTATVRLYGNAEGFGQSTNEPRSSVTVTFSATADVEILGKNFGSAQLKLISTANPSATLFASASASITFTLREPAIGYDIYEGPYVKYLKSIAPTWLLYQNGARWMEAHGDGLDAIADMIKAAVLVKFIMRAPEDALDVIGVERGIKRVSGETLEDYRNRLKSAWSYWEWGGTKKGVQEVLNTFGYYVEIIELYTIDPTRWSDFAITVAPIEGVRTRVWGDEGKWADGGWWGQGWKPTPSEIEALANVVGQMKAAHTRFARLEWFSQPTYNKWGDGGKWGEGYKWPYRTEVVYYA